VRLGWNLGVSSGAWDAGCMRAIHELPRVSEVGADAPAPFNKMSVEGSDGNDAC